MRNEKSKVALISVFTSLFLTGFKLIIGLITRSLGIGERTTNVLMDKLPKDSFAKVEEVLKRIPEIIRYHNLRIRESGADTFVDLNIIVAPDLTKKQAHAICNKVEDEVRKVIKGSDVFVHAEPEEKIKFKE